MNDKIDQTKNLNSQKLFSNRLVELLKLAEQKGFLFYDFQSDTIIATHRLALSDSNMFNQIKDLKNVSSLPNNLLQHYIRSLENFLQV